ncbi:hypothetical protein BOX15_Mlig001780g2 [Macrostomum lignano]|uniref:Uncharacterized protein n=1 Tax=Macrostomum lignano TaxID=282301 RepID=A0A267DX54_9PLAT|nr:hypothetical protein BOX15_Mlig001780g2 [Macrostomum lignano]
METKSLGRIRPWLCATSCIVCCVSMCIGGSLNDGLSDSSVIRSCNRSSRLNVVHQRLWIKEESWNEYHLRICFNEIFYSGSWDMIRRNCIKNSHYHVHGGWVKAFSSSQEFYVLGGSEIIFNMVTGFKVDDNYSEMFEAKLGLTIVQRDFFRYELILLDAGFCRPG